MRFLVTFMLFACSVLFAEYQRQHIDIKLIESNIPIIDIRTPGEWKNTGLVKGSIPIMFFNEHGTYDVNDFLKQLNARIDTTQQFALICNSGSRTKLVSNFLSEKLKYHVIDLKGGILYAIDKKMPMEPYKEHP